MEQTDNSAEDMFSLRANDGAVSVYHSVETKVNSHGGLLTFDYNMIGSSPTRLYFYVDGINKLTVYGVANNQFSIQLEPGERVLKWQYLNTPDSEILLDNIFIPAEADSDMDGLGDAWEYKYYGDLDTDYNSDTDSDGLSNLQEFNFSLNPTVSDTDGDGLLDGWEIELGTDPLVDDSSLDPDEDGFTNIDEYFAGTDINDANSYPTDKLLIDFENNNLSTFGWYSPESSTSDWGIVNTNTSESNVYSLKSGDITHNQKSIAEIMFNSFGGRLSFDFKVSSESRYDYFNVYVDTDRVLRVSGENSVAEGGISGIEEIPTYKHFEYDLSSGFHRIIFEYYKDGSVSNGSDSTWIDNVDIPAIPDSDEDGILDSLEYKYFGSLDGDTEGDRDGDGLPNGQELILGTDLDDTDTDGDGYEDGWEVDQGLDPTDDDSISDNDNDGFTNIHELLSGTDLQNAESYPQGTWVDFDEGAITPFYWVMNSESSWTLQSDDTYNNSAYSLMSGLGNESEVSIYIDSNGGLISFNFSFIKESSSELEFLIDDVVAASWSDDVDSTAITLEIPEGVHKVMWRVTGEAFARIDHIFVPAISDGDGDGVDDSLEYYFEGNLDKNYSDWTIDTDSDGLNDLEELIFGSDIEQEDSDSDGLTDLEEHQHGTDPRNADTDGDMMSDAYEVTNDLDPRVDDADLDFDEDGFSNSHEYYAHSAANEAESVPYGTWIDFDEGELSPFYWIMADSDNYWQLGTSDTFENSAYSLRSGWDGSLTSIHINSPGGMMSFYLTYSGEYYGTLELLVDDVIVGSYRGWGGGETILVDIPSGVHQLAWKMESGESVSIDHIFVPAVPDSDEDGVDDSLEYHIEGNLDKDYAAWTVDSDSDGLNDLDELFFGSDLNIADSDGDGLSDLEEQENTTDPLNVDSDGDDINDAYEVANGLDPNNWDADADLDGDGFTNYQEYMVGSMANDGMSLPSGTLIDFEGNTRGSFYLKDSGLNPWDLSVTENSSEDMVGLRSGTVEPNAESKIETVIESEGGLFSFDYRVSSRSSTGFLQLYINDELIESWSGSRTGTFNYLLNAGEQHIAWKYMQTSSSGTSGSNAAWLNRVFLPAVPDSDDDGISDAQEYLYYGSLNVDITSDLDTDEDGVNDVLELEQGLNPTLNDTDGDGLLDGWEIQYGLDPLVNDSELDHDDDGFSTIHEVEVGTDFQDASSYPIGTWIDFDEGGVSPFYWVMNESPWHLEMGGTYGDSPYALWGGWDDGSSASIHINSLGGAMSFQLAFSGESDGTLELLVDDVVVDSWSGWNTVERISVEISSGTHKITWRVVEGEPMGVDHIFVPAMSDSDEDGVDDSLEYHFEGNLGKDYAAWTVDTDSDGFSDLLEIWNDSEFENPESSPSGLFIDFDEEESELYLWDRNGESNLEADGTFNNSSYALWIGGDEVSSASIDVNSDGGAMSFYLTYDSGVESTLELLIDDVVFGSWVGQARQEDILVKIPSGNHSISWQVDSGGSVGIDHVFIPGSLVEPM